MNDEDPIDRSDDLRSLDRALLVALSHHQGDRSRLSLDEECLLENWVAGHLSLIDADRAAKLAKHNVFAAEHVLKCWRVSAANEGPDVPDTLAERVLIASRSLITSRSPGTRTAGADPSVFYPAEPEAKDQERSTLAFEPVADSSRFLRQSSPAQGRAGGRLRRSDIATRPQEGRRSINSAARRIFNLRWSTFSAWQWSGLGALAAATIVIAVLGFRFWQQQLRPEQSFQIAMVTLDDRSVLAEGVRRTRGLQPEGGYAGFRRPAERSQSGLAAGGPPFRDINIPTALLQRAITSASNSNGAAEHSELMNLLHAQNGTYNTQASILIDSVLADSLRKNLAQSDNTEVRVYDLDDLRAGNIRSKIEPPPKDAHFLFLTVRR